MQRKTSIFFIVAAAGTALFLWFGGGSGDKGLGPVPDLALSDYDGNKVNISDLKGKVAVVNAWAVWCPFCKDELPDLARLQEEFPDDIIVVAIDRAEPLAKAKGFTDEIGVTDKMMFLLDPKDSFYASIGGFAMPETIFVDRKGIIQIHKRGPMEYEEMREKVHSLLTQ